MELSLFDAYNLRARFSVAIFYSLPFIADAALCDRFSGFLPTVILGIALVSICQAAMGMVRDAGTKQSGNNRNIAAQLLEPGSSLPEITKRRYYRKLAALEPGFAPFGTLLDEKGLDEKETKILCEAAVRWLRGQTRDAKMFSLLKEENINYGFARNMYALRIPGVILNGATALALLYQSGFFVHPTLYALSIPQVFFHLAWLLYLWLGTTEETVEKAAKRYADSLLEAIDLL